MFPKFCFTVTTVATNKGLFKYFLLEISKSNHCVLPILATSRTLACLEQKMTWIVGTSGESACNNTMPWSL